MVSTSKEHGPGLEAFSLLSPGNRLALAVLNSRLAGRSAGVPHSLFLGLTRRCQLSCAHCRYGQEPYRGKLPPDMPASLARRGLKQAAALGIPRVIFFGGEPSLYRGLPGLISFAVMNGLFTELDTNGLRLLDRAFLRSLVRAGLSAVRVSVHSADGARHDALSRARTFDKAAAALEAARAAGLLAYISSCAFSGARRESLSGLVRFAKKTGAHGVRVLPYAGGTEAGFSPRSLAAGLAAAAPDGYARSCGSGGKKTCAARLRDIVYIDQAGAVRPCPYALEKLGSMKVSPLAEILGRRQPAAPFFPCRRAGILLK